MTIAMITHEVPGDSFWDLIRKGAEAAAKKDNIELRYSNDPEAPNQANLVQTAIDSDVKGIAVTLAKPDAMAPAVKAAEAKGIPVVAFNSGFDDWQGDGRQGVLRPGRETSPGQAAGDRLNDDGAKKVICVIQEQGQVALESRCAGVKNTFPGRPRSSTSTARTCRRSSRRSPPSCSRTRASTTSSTLGAPFALTAVQSVKNAGSSAKVGTFDTNAALVDAIKAGDVQWAVDQQPFLQGYLAIDSLWLYLNNGNVIGGGQADADRPVVHRQVQHRRGRRVRQERNALTCRREYRCRPDLECQQRSSTTNGSRNETAFSAC